MNMAHVFGAAGATPISPTALAGNSTGRMPATPQPAALPQAERTVSLG